MWAVRIIQAVALVVGALLLLASALRTPPGPGELSRIEGVSGQPTFVPAERRSREYALLQILVSPYEHRLVKTYDIGFARSLVPGTAVVAGVHQDKSFLGPSHAELWTLEQAGAVSRSYEQTLAIRGPEMAESARSARVFAAGCLAFAAVALLTRLWRGNG